MMADAKISVIEPIVKMDNENKAYGIFTHKRVFSNLGTDYHIDYAPEVMADGSIELHEVGRTNIQEMINSHRDSVDISVIMSRYANGDLKALERRQALYFDATDAPSSYVEVLNRAMKAEAYFGTLSADERSHYNNDWTQWLASMDDPEKGYKMPSKSELASQIADVRNVPGDAKDPVSAVESAVKTAVKSKIVSEEVSA